MVRHCNSSTAACLPQPCLQRAKGKSRIDGAPALINLSERAELQLVQGEFFLCAADSDVTYLVDSQAFYVKHVNGEPGSQLLLYNTDNMYWALNVLLAQTISDGACTCTPPPLPRNTVTNGMLDFEL